LLAAAATFMLRKRAELAPAGSEPVHDIADDARGLTTPARSVAPAPVPLPVSKPVATTSNAVLLSALKEELFAIESEKLSGTLSPQEYAEIKTGLEAVLKRALTRK